MIKEDLAQDIYECIVNLTTYSFILGEAKKAQEPNAAIKEAYNEEYAVLKNLLEFVKDSRGD